MVRLCVLGTVVEDEMHLNLAEVPSSIVGWKTSISVSGCPTK